jgi:serralysin
MTRISDTAAASPDFLDSIFWGTQISTSSIDVYFAPQGEVFGGKTSKGWSAYEIQQAMLAFEQISNVCDVTFNITTNAADAELKLVTKNSQNFLGYFNPPGTVDEGVGVFAPNGYGWDDFAGGGLEQGGYGFITLIHEFGHAMGLAHPHDRGGSSNIWEGVTSPFDSFGTFNLNQGIYTTMSYNDGWPLHPSGENFDPNFGYQGSMMAFDIAALQQLYGANTTFASGDDIYRLAGTNESGTFFQCIWDTGGTDTIKYIGLLDTVINLNAATMDYSASAGGLISWADGIYGGYTIAQGVVIENAKGGRGDDDIFGNSAKNELRGGQGNDHLEGGNGRDTLLGGGGADDLIGGRGRDIMKGGGGADTFIFLSEKDSGLTDPSRDKIQDFKSGVDLIDLSAIDAVPGGGDNMFNWVDAASFSMTAGELRWEVFQGGVLVQGDMDGDGVSDFEVFLSGTTSVAGADFIL